MRDLRGSKTSDYGDTLFYLTTMERSKRCSLAALSTPVECYFHGYATRYVETIIKHFGINGPSSSLLSKANKILAEQFKVWRNRGLGEYSFMLLHACYQRMRHSGVVRNVAVLSAIDIYPQGTQSLLGVSVAISEADIYRRSFLDSLVERKLRGGVFFVSDDRSGLKVTCQIVFTGVKRQRCQFHLSQNSVRHAPDERIKKSTGDDLRKLCNTENLERTQIALHTLVDKYSKITPKRVAWLEINVPVAFTVFSIHKNHGRNMKLSKLIERANYQQIKPRPRKVSIFPDEASLLRLVTSI